ncbi:MAG: S8 family serine peptidase [Actinomycetota bacterium]
MLIEEPFVEGEVIVKYAASASTTDRSEARAAVGAVDAAPISDLAPRTEVLKLDGSKSVAQAVATLRDDPDVRIAEPNYILTPTAVSNDPTYTSGGLWGMYGDATSPVNQYGSHAGEAWAAGYVGSSNVYVVVIDEGIDVSHPDLVGNIWTNPFDPIDGIDNDGNGFIDDVNGWDFVNNDRSVYDAGGDAHGTHVSGTIGGVGGNGIGVAGVNWDVTLISAKFLGSGGGSTADAVRAIDYATQLKVRHGLNIVATSNSWGGGGFSQALLDAINRGGDAGILFIAAAGNSNSNNDATNNYPSNYECTRTAAGAARGWDCMIAVAATTSSGAKASFSSYGATRVDLGAPGEGITSTTPGNTYSSYSGTSMATPHVSGAAALCASANPAMTASQIRAAILSTAAPTPSLAGITATGARLDVGALMGACRPATAPVSGAPTGLGATALSDSRVRLTWTDGTTGESYQEVQRAEVTSGTCGTFATVATVGADTTSTTVEGLAASTEHCFRIRAGNAYGTGSTTAWTAVARATTLEPPPLHVCAATTYAWIDPATATAMNLSDDSTALMSLGFTTQFLGSSFTQVYVGSNGILGFGTPVSAYLNEPIPSTTGPNNYAAPWWDDLDPGAGGRVSRMTIGTAGSRQFVVTWQDVPFYGAAGSGITFQAVITEGVDGVLFQYLDVVGSSAAHDGGAGATIGTENADGTRGTQFSYNRTSVTNGSAVRCALPSTTPPTISTTTLPAGTTGTAYSATLAATGGATPYTWSLASGTLPAGLTLAGSGTITGTPTTTGTANLTVRVTDATSATTTKALSITVAAPTMQIASVTLTTGRSGTQSFATARVLVVDGKGAPVANAKVSGQWSLERGSATSRTATTGANGWASLRSPNYANATGKTVSFCVLGATRSGYTARIATSCASAIF